VITGTAVTMAPVDKIRRMRVALPEVELHRHDRYQELVARAVELGPIPTAVVHPCDRAALEGAVRAAEARLIVPVLVGPQATIRTLASSLGLDVATYEIVDTENSLLWPPRPSP
jgi:phosphate acetyltransferase